jgi:hypothetical protein
MSATARPTQVHSHAGGQAGAKPKLYNPRHPERTLLYQTIAEHFEACGHDYFVAYSCKGRGVCPSCNTRRMVAGDHWTTRNRALVAVGFRCTGAD